MAKGKESRDTPSLSVGRVLDLLVTAQYRRDLGWDFGAMVNGAGRTVHSTGEARYCIVLRGDDLKAGRQRVVVTESYHKDTHIARPMRLEDTLLTDKLASAIQRELNPVERRLLEARAVGGSPDLRRYRTPGQLDAMLQEAGIALSSYHREMASLVHDSHNSYQAYTRLQEKGGKLDAELGTLAAMNADRKRRIEDFKAHFTLRKAADDDFSALAGFIRESLHGRQSTAVIDAYVRENIGKGLLGLYGDRLALYVYVDYTMTRLPTGEERLAAVLSLNNRDGPFLREKLANEYDCYLAIMDAAPKIYAGEADLVGVVDPSFGALKKVDPDNDSLRQLFSEAGCTIVKDVECHLSDHDKNPRTVSCFYRAISAAPSVSLPDRPAGTHAVLPLSSSLPQ